MQANNPYSPTSTNPISLDSPVSKLTASAQGLQQSLSGLSGLSGLPGGKHVGSVVGWANMWGNLGAACLPLVLGYLAAQAGWHFAFIVCGVVQLIAAVAALGINASKPLQARQD